VRVGLCRVVQIVDDEPEHGRVRRLRLAPDTLTSGDSESAVRVFQQVARALPGAK